MYNNYENLTQKEKNSLVKQYEGCVITITNQFNKKTGIEWQVLQSWALEGLAEAFIKYDETKTSQSFGQFAMYRMRWRILRAINGEREDIVIKYPQYAYTTGHIDINPYRKCEINDPNYNLAETMVSYTEVDEWDAFYNMLEKKYHKQLNLEIFYKRFGLKGYDETSNVDLSKEYGLRRCNISTRTTDVIKFIKNDKELFEVLKSMKIKL